MIRTFLKKREYKRARRLLVKMINNNDYAVLETMEKHIEYGSVMWSYLIRLSKMFYETQEKALSILDTMTGGDLLSQKNYELTDSQTQKAAATEIHEGQMLEKQKEIQKLQFKLTDAMNQISTLTSQNEMLEEKIVGLAMKFANQMSIDELRNEKCNFAVYQDAETQKWHVVTGMCSLGGCDYRYLEFDTEKEALLKALEKTAKRERVDISCACPECYAEYMQDCI